jgi:hypothetical protein
MEAAAKSNSQFRTWPVVLLFALSVVLYSSAGQAQGQPRTFGEPPATTYSPAAFQVTMNGAAETWQGANVSAGFFDAAQVRPFIGRFFLEGEYGAANPSVVVLSHDLWQRRFGGARQVIGSKLQLNDQSVTVVGVGPPGFASPMGAVLWVPQAK